MYELKIRDYCFIAHSLKDDFFGPAKHLHGTTYIIDMMLLSDKLISNNIIIDIGLATDILKTVIEKYNYKNLDNLDEFKDEITTTEFMAKRFTDEIFDELKTRNFQVNKLSAIKISLKENHLASASYTKTI